MNDTGGPIVNVAMPARASDGSENLARSSLGDRKRRRPTAQETLNTECEEEIPVGVPQHQLDSLA